MGQTINSNTEISDVIILLKDFEKKLIYEDLRPLKSASSQYENHPLAQELKKKISGIIYAKHFSQLALSHNYFCKYLKTVNDVAYYDIKNIQAIDTNKSREVRIVNGRYQCECSTYQHHGLVCRHVFALAIMFQQKTLENIELHKRWETPLIQELANERSEFESIKILDYLKSHDKKENNNENQEEEKDSINENQKDKPNFVTGKKTRGAPKKEKRLKSCLEKKKTNQKSHVGKSNNS